jgi:hypothetical protein
MAPEVIDEMIVRHPREERSQVVLVVELPLRLTEAFQNVGPDRLDDIYRVELGAQRGRQAPPDHRSKDRLIIAEDPLGGLGFAVG